MEWQWFIAVIAVPVLGGIVVWTIRLQTRLSSFMIKAAETYVTKDDLTAFQTHISERFDRLEKQIDRLFKSGK